MPAFKGDEGMKREGGKKRGRREGKESVPSSFAGAPPVSGGWRSGWPLRGLGGRDGERSAPPKIGLDPPLIKSRLRMQHHAE